MRTYCRVLFARFISLVFLEKLRIRSWRKNRLIGDEKVLHDILNELNTDSAYKDRINQTVNACRMLRAHKTKRGLVVLVFGEAVTREAELWLKEHADKESQ